MLIEMGLGSGMGCQSDQKNLRDGIKMLRHHGIKHVAQTTATKRPEAVRHRETYSAPNRTSMFVKWKLGRPYHSAHPSRDMGHKPFSMGVSILCSPGFFSKTSNFWLCYIALLFKNTSIRKEENRNRKIQTVSCVVNVFKVELNNHSILAVLCLLCPGALFPVEP